MQNLDPRLRALKISEDNGGGGDNGSSEQAGGDQQQLQPNGGPPMHNGNGTMAAEEEKAFKWVAVLLYLPPTLNSYSIRTLYTTRNDGYMALVIVEWFLFVLGEMGPSHEQMSNIGAL